MIVSSTRWQASEGFRLMRAPGRTYDRRVIESSAGSWAAALSVPVLLTLLLGVVTSIATTGRITARLVVSQALCWCFVPLVQFAIGTLLVASSPRRAVDLPRAIELLFAAHLPWSLWLAGVAGYHMFPTRQLVVTLSAIPAAAWTCRMLFAYTRRVLGLSRRDAWLRVLAHQATTFLVIVVYVELTSSLWTRIVWFFR